MSLPILVAAGRARADSIMSDTCTITRKTTTFTDPDTGVRTQTTTTLYTGKCRVKQNSASASASEPGEALSLLLTLTVQVPMSVTGVEPDDIVTVTASQMDPDLVGRKFAVKDLAHSSHTTARRLGVQEVT